MRFVQAIRDSPSFGAAILAIRQKSQFCREDLAELLAIDVNELRDIEQSKKCGQTHLPGQIANVMGLTTAERALLVDKRKSELLHSDKSECKQCAKKEASTMHPGNGERHDACVHVNGCIDQVARNFPQANRAHCPAKCTRRRDATREELRADAMMPGLVSSQVRRRRSAA